MKNFVSDVIRLYSGLKSIVCGSTGNRLAIYLTACAIVGADEITIRQPVRSMGSIVGHNYPSSVVHSETASLPLVNPANFSAAPFSDSRKRERSRVFSKDSDFKPVFVANLPNRQSVGVAVNHRNPDNDLQRVFGDELAELIGTQTSSASNDSPDLPENEESATDGLEAGETQEPTDTSPSQSPLAEFLEKSLSKTVAVGSIEPESTGNEPSAAASEILRVPDAEVPVEESISVADQPAVNTVVPAPQKPSLVITPRMEALKGPMRQVLALYEQQYLNTAEHSCWSVMHLMLGLGTDGHLFVSNQRNRVVRAYDWLCSNQLCAGRQLLYLENGLIRGREGPGYQGHPCQFLAMLAQIDTPESAPLWIEGRQFTVSDLIESEKATCREGVELTFKLISMSHYLDSDAKWKNTQGVEWDIPRLIAAELAEPINGAACGGTHRLMGISYAALTREQQGKELNGQWWRAQKYTRDYHKYTLTLQNPDGGFSSDWFKKRSDWGDLDRKIQTTGHMLEWLVFTLPKEELSDPRLVKSVTFLTELMASNRYHEWEVGPKCHAVRALDVYYRRVFGERPRVSHQNPQLTNHPAPPNKNGFLSRLKDHF